MFKPSRRSRRCFICGSFLLVIFHVYLCYAVFSVPCSLVDTCLERALPLGSFSVNFFLCFCHFPICVLIRIRNKGEVSLSPPVIIFTDRSFFCGSFFLFIFHICLHFAVLSIHCSLAITCWERAGLFALLCVMFLLCFCHLPTWCLGSGVILDCIDSLYSPSSLLPIIFEPVHKISNNVVCATSKASDQPAHMRSLIRAYARRLSIL